MSILKTLSRQYLGSPQLITATKFKEIADLLDMSKGRESLQEFFKPMTKESRLQEKLVDPFYSGYKFEEDSGEVKTSPENYGVIKVEGPLTYRPESRMCAPDLTNYQELLKETEALIAEGKKQIFMIHNSPGGEAYMLFQTAKEIRKLADESGVELIGFVDGMAASASYGLLSVCHKVIANHGASIGSVGVVISLLNDSEKMKKEGYKRQFITAGASKVPFDSEGEFKEEFIDDLRAGVNELYEEFTSHVSEYRESMTIKDVKNTEAKVFRAKDALALGLIDEVMTISDFKKTYMSGDNKETTSQSKITNQEETLMAGDNTPKADADLATQLAAMQEKLQKQEQLLTSQTSALETYQKQEQATKQTELEQRLDSTGFLADCKEDLVGFFMSDKTDEVTKTLMSTVIDKAEASNKEVKTLAEADVAKAVTQKDAAEARAEKAEKDAVDAREEFGNKEQQSDDSTITTKDSISREASLGEWVEKQKSNQSK